MTSDTAPEVSRRRRRRRSRKRAGFGARVIGALRFWEKEWFRRATRTRLAMTAGLLVLLGVLAWHAASLGLAHLQVLRVENSLAHWTKQGRAPSASSLQQAFAAIDRAIALHPDNPYQLTLRARLLGWRAFASAGEEFPRAEYEQALALYRRAAALRPLWPESWAEMVDVKLNLGEVDGELERFLERADTLGPYTPAVHIATVRAGFAQLQRYPFQNPPLLEKHLLRGLQDPRSRRQVLGLVEQYEQQAYTCRLLARIAREEGESSVPKLSFCRKG
ncbi:VpsP family polysaccharide biosynthesis protein [Microbulbifer yueqingensis]|uniref:Tetratricopeptide repeat protein n=1 Tax=Microbulbifer yueqingensis TaxID=658219 RepID=A0A1G8VKG6_9GAMM|nr:VpsP family polysaccharide biosynthesis protein [Microbulbifer yueqingensis]SDJ66493.1 hypothetical protein SAMN05216212_0610 [Microbulbifer yueqingensis]